MKRRITACILFVIMIAPLITAASDKLTQAATAGDVKKVSNILSPLQNKDIVTQEQLDEALDKVVYNASMTVSEDFVLYKDYVEIVDILVKAGAKTSFISLPISEGKIELIEILLNTEVELNKGLRIAVIHEQAEMVSFLLKSGADPNAKDERGCSILDIYDGRGHNDNGEVARILKNAGAKNLHHKWWEIWKFGACW